MILITGATGSIGQGLCKLLAQSNIQARAMCRKEEQLAQFTEMGLEAVIGDFENPESLRNAMQGCERMFLLVPPAENQFEHYVKAIDAAVEVKIEHIVKISAADSNLDSDVPWAKANAHGDHYLRSKQVRWTIIRPTGFMQNFLEAGKAISEGFLPNSTGDRKVSYIDLRDIALVAKNILIEDGHFGATYFLTGPEALSAKDIAPRLSIGLGYEVKNIPTTMEEMRSRLMQAGLTKWRIDAIIAQYETIKGAYAVDVTEEVQRLTGFAPRNFERFVQDYKEHFLKG